MVLLLFITGVREGSHTSTLDKGQTFGAGLQLCASGVSAEAAPYGDQRLPHTVKCQAQRRARGLKPKRRGQDKNMFYSGEFRSGALERAGLDTEHYHAHSPAVTGRKHATKLALFCHPSVIPATFMLQSARFRGLGAFCNHVLRSFWGQICS